MVIDLTVVDGSCIRVNLFSSCVFVGFFLATTKFVELIIFPRTLIFLQFISSDETHQNCSNFVQIVRRTWVNGSVPVFPEGLNCTKLGVMQKVL
jgi:hypothetical protein